MRMKIAFTLAEVLVTLMIIGVISAITMPTLKKISNDNTQVTAAKKAYASVTLATKNIKRKEGSVRSWVGSSTESTEMIKLYQNEMELIPITASTSYKGKYLNGEELQVVTDMKTVDGMTYHITGSQNCNFTTDDYKNACILIEVDTNGPNKPNIVGLDIVGFYVTSDGSVYPYGTGKDITPSSCTKDGKGWGCSAKIIMEGKISW